MKGNLLITAAAGLAIIVAPCPPSFATGVAVGSTEVPSSKPAAPDSNGFQPYSGPYHDSAINFTFRESYAALTLTHKQVFPEPRLGYGLHYTAPDGWKVSIFVYDLGHKDIPDGNKSEVVSIVFRKAAQEVQMVHDKLREAKVAWPKDVSEVFHTASLQGEDIEGRQVMTHLLVTGHSGRFIKLRCTYDVDEPASAPRRFNSLAEAVQALAADLAR